MTQTLEILLGMAVFYFAFSPRFRKFVKKSINSWQPPKQETETSEIISPQNKPKKSMSFCPDCGGWMVKAEMVWSAGRNVRKYVCTKCTKTTIHPVRERVEVSKGGKLEVDEGTLAKWMENPEVKVRQ